MDSDGYATCQLLQHIGTEITKQSDQLLLERLGVGMSQVKILLLLREDHYLPQRTLANKLSQTEAAISRQIKILISKELLITQVNPKNRRQHLVVPTAKGERLTEAALEVLAQYQDSVLTKLTSRQQKQLAEILTELHRQICQSTTHDHQR